MIVRWSPEALQDREDIWLHIAMDSPSAAGRLDDRLAEAAARLGEFPGLGRPGLAPGTRELIPHESYRLVYTVEESEVWVLAVVHVARQWPPVIGEGIEE